MESDTFDNLVRGAFKGASRRGVVRVGVGALAASALASMGLRSNDAEAKKKKKPVCNCTSSDPATCSTQKLSKKAKKNLLSSNPCAYSGSCTAGVSGCPSTCTGATPVTCGEGCCPATFSKCCVANVSDYPPGTQTCNPTSFTCCPAELGGGSCGGGAPTCCPPTRNSAFGNCADADEKCCTAAQGGGTCDADETCCPPNLSNPQDSGSCCAAGQQCCITGGAACPAGQVCDGDLNDSGCCVPDPPRTTGRNRRRSGTERFHMVAR
jgi:hypothetical protein